MGKGTPRPLADVLGIDGDAFAAVVAAQLGRSEMLHGHRVTDGLSLVRALVFERARTLGVTEVFAKRTVTARHAAPVKPTPLNEEQRKSREAAEYAQQRRDKPALPQTDETWLDQPPAQPRRVPASASRHERQEQFEADVRARHREEAAERSRRLDLGGEGQDALGLRRQALEDPNALPAGTVVSEDELCPDGEPADGVGRTVKQQ